MSKNIENNSKLFIVLVFYFFLPTLYSTVRFYLLGDYDNNVLTIGSQIQLLNIIYEVLYESLIIPAYYYINCAKDKVNYTDRIKSIFLLILITYFIVFCFIYFFADKLILFMKQDSAFLADTAYYLKLEAFALIFDAVFKFCIVLFIIEEEIKKILFFAFFKLVITVAGDIIFLNGYITGINGLAYTNIISSIILVIIALFNLKAVNANVFHLYNGLYTLIKNTYEFVISTFKAMFLFGTESALRNIIFAYMILRMVNTLNEQGIFWMAVTFMWMWLLFPIIQLGEVIKNDISKNVYNLNNNFNTYLLWTAVIVILWIICIPLYKVFFKYIYNSDEYNILFHIVIISLPFYIFYAYGSIITNIFYGIGKAKYILLQSLIINIIYYGIFFIAYKIGVFSITLYNIVLLFGGSMGCGAVINFILFARYKKMLHKNHFSLT